MPISPYERYKASHSTAARGHGFLWLVGHDDVGEYGAHGNVWRAGWNITDHQSTPRAQETIETSVHHQPVPLSISRAGNKEGGFLASGCIPRPCSCLCLCLGAPVPRAEHPGCGHGKVLPQPWETMSYPLSPPLAWSAPVQVALPNVVLADLLVFARNAPQNTIVHIQDAVNATYYSLLLLRYPFDIYSFWLDQDGETCLPVSPLFRFECEQVFSFIYPSQASSRSI